jgi:hypothetical protein
MVIGYVHVCVRVRDRVCVRVHDRIFVATPAIGEAGEGEEVLEMQADPFPPCLMTYVISAAVNCDL